MAKRKASKITERTGPSPEQLREALLLLGERDDVEGHISSEVLIQLVHKGLLTWPEPDTVEFTEAGEAAYERLQRGEEIPELVQD